MDIFSNPSDWLLRVVDLKPLDILTIHPRGSLTGEKVVKAMGAQGYLKLKPGFVIREHGSKIFIQREA